MRRIFVYGMQSSGASLFTYFLGQIPNTVAVVDLWSYCLSPKLETSRMSILKATINCKIALEHHYNRYRPDLRILFIRNPVQNYLSLNIKHYRDWHGSAQDKFKVLEKIFRCKETLFDLVILYENFIADPITTVYKLNEVGVNILPSAIVFDRTDGDIVDFNNQNSVWCRNNYLKKWGFGNIHFNTLSQLTAVTYPDDKSIHGTIDTLCPSVMSSYDKFNSEC